MNNKRVISTLNDLIETAKEGEEGYMSCAKDVIDMDLKTLLTHRANSCALAAAELQGLVRSRGGDPATHSSVAGTLHRSWVDIKSAILRKDTVAALNECEHLENYALRSYRAALDADLPADIRVIVERQFHGVFQMHDRIEGLSDQIRVAT